MKHMLYFKADNFYVLTLFFKSQVVEIDGICILNIWLLFLLLTRPRFCAVSVWWVWTYLLPSSFPASSCLKYDPSTYEKGKWVWAGATLWPGGSEIHAKSDKSETGECATLITIGPYSTAPELPVYMLLIVWGNKNRNFFLFCYLQPSMILPNTLTQMIKSTCQYIYSQKYISMYHLWFSLCRDYSQMDFHFGSDFHSGGFRFISY